MSGAPPPDPAARLRELQADHVLGGLGAEEQRELERLAHEHGVAPTDPRLEALTGALVVALVGEHEPMPGEVRERLERAADEFASRLADGSGGGVAGRIGSGNGKQWRTGRGGDGATLAVGPMGWVGWTVAALLAITSVIGWRSVFASGSSEASPVELRERLSSDPKSVRLEWSAWGESETPQAEGDIVWVEDEDRGVMWFRNLPPNTPDRPVYQLWIVDAEMGFDRRVSGGVFTVEPGQEEVVVPIDPAHPISEAAAFAVTIEREGGVGVSTMERKAVIAQRQS